ncbi:hypothetical protein Tco_0717144 [Tanacetum coccineum]
MTSNDNTPGHRIQDHNNEPSSSKLVPNVSTPADTTDPSLQDLELLSSPMYEEYFTTGNQSVSKASAFSDNSQQHDTQPTLNIRQQLATEPEMRMFVLILSTAEPKNIKEAMADHAWIEAMQEKLHQFDRLNVWELVDKPFGKTAINLKWLL